MNQDIHDAALGRRGRAPVAELIYDSTCPNVDSCRAALRAVLVEMGLPLSWTEWDRSGDATPPAYRNYGSPTVLVDGNDIAASSAGTTSYPPTPCGNSCRLYVGEDTGALCGTPPVELIRNAFSAAIARHRADAPAPDRVT